jgi:hypothetical protein
VSKGKGSHAAGLLKIILLLYNQTTSETPNRRAAARNKGVIGANEHYHKDYG